MQANPVAHTPRPIPNATPDDSSALGDVRFRALLTDAEWQALPLSVRRRFSKRLAGGDTAVYVGAIEETAVSPLGWLLAQALRIIGGPFPLGCEPGVPSVVTVTEDGVSGGQVWTRLYARRRGFPQVIHSAKRFAGPTGLEEHVGFGVGMALKLSVEDGALKFRSAGYFCKLFGHRFALPAWASPGALCITHAELGDGRFLFRLELTHPRFGALLRQSAAFREARP
jgi:hypothetical protein